jgi:hypothetical protein
LKFPQLTFLRESPSWRDDVAFLPSTTLSGPLKCLVTAVAALLGVVLTGSPLNAEPLPNLNPSGVETAFTANQGDYYVYGIWYGYDANVREDFRFADGTLLNREKPDWILDGGAGLGFGLGSSARFVSLQVGYNFNSFRDIEKGGSIDVKLSRDLVLSETLRLSMAAGVQGVYSHGEGSEEGSSPFAVMTMALPVRFEGSKRTLQMNAGYGGGKFRGFGSPSILEQGVFGSVGMEVSDNVGLSLGWAGRGVNSTLSIAPFQGKPLFVNISANNLFNHASLGRVAVIGVTWGGNFRTAAF